jgi:hypothetical protein
MPSLQGREAGEPPGDAVVNESRAQAHQPKCHSGEAPDISLRYILGSTPSLVGAEPAGWTLTPRTESNLI